MESLPKEFIALLQYLLPGFVAAWVFYSFTSFPKPSQFERVVQALIFTIIVQAFLLIIRKCFFWVDNKWLMFTWDKDSALWCSIVLAVLLGTLFSFFANNDAIHKKLRDIGITRESSYPSEWFGAFLKNVTFVVLHLDGERRIYGWPREWPSESGKGHFVLEQACWLTEENEQIPLVGVKSIMIDVKEINMVEFMEKSWEESNG